MSEITNIINESKIDTREYFKKICQKKINSLEKKKLRNKTCYCPHCNVRHKYTHKGRRNRKLRTSGGIIEFKLKQIKCKNCLKIYRPLIGWLDLKPRQVITEELLEKAIFTAINCSYANSSKITRIFTKEKISPRTIRKALIKESDKIKAEKAKEKPKEFKAMLNDSTKGKTGKTTRGEDINIVYGLTGRRFDINQETGEVKRSYFIGDIIHVSVGNKKSFANIQHTTENMMTDGDRSIKNKVKTMRNYEKINLHRCNWHLPRMLGYTLWNDDLIKKSDRKKYINKLHSIIHYSFNNYKTYYEELIAECQKDGLRKSVKYLQNAKQEFYNTKEKPIIIDNIPLLANSPVERVMREIDRRVDNGSRWSSKGLEAMTRVRLNYVYN